jgi:hypothetical protein
MAVSSSPLSWPYGGTPLAKSSTYRSPETTVPGAADGVIVTLTVTV